MSKIHSFELYDTAVARESNSLLGITQGSKYRVIGVGFWSIKIINDHNREFLICPSNFDHHAVTTITKKHLRRIVLKG